jgi:hypothetical protein
VRRFWIAPLAAAALIGTNASSAGAAVTIGQTAPSLASLSSCGSPTAFVQDAVALGSPTYTVPAGGGVITSWTTQAVNTPDKAAELKIFARTGTPGHYLVQAQEGPHVLTGGVLNTFPARIPVKADEILGLYYSTIGTGCEFDGVPGDLTRYIFAAIPDPPLGSTYMTNFADNGFRVNVSAVLEPDGDADAFGDETQDKCVGTPGTANGCPSTVTIDKLKQKGDTKVKVTATVPGAGTLKVASPSDPALASAAKKKSLKAVTRTLTATTKQQLKLTLKLTKSAIAKLGDVGKLKLRVKAVYTPVGGPPGSQTKKKTLKS